MVSYYLILLLVSLYWTTANYLPYRKQACIKEEIFHIPDENEFYEEPVQVSFDSAMSINNVLVSRILEEECGFRDRDLLTSKTRERRSPIAQRIFRLSKYFLHFYEKNKEALKPELLRGITQLAEKLQRRNAPIHKTKFGQIGKFFYMMWKDLNVIRAEFRDEYFEEVLENTLRLSFQLLIHNGDLSEMLLYHPLINSKIKRRIPTENSALLSAVSATNVVCHQNFRDSQVVILLKLRIPKLKKTIVDRCDDIGRIVGNTYQYYELPTATFSNEDHSFKVKMDKCVHEHITFCPADSIKPTNCSRDKIERCPLKIEKSGNIVRELQIGFAIYGEFTQLVNVKNDLQSLWVVQPRTLYHLIPQSGEVISIGKTEIQQITKSKETVIQQLT